MKGRRRRKTQGRGAGGRQRRWQEGKEAGKVEERRKGREIRERQRCDGDRKGKK